MIGKSLAACACASLLFIGCGGSSNGSSTGGSGGSSGTSDPCSDSAVQAACAQASTHVQSCCGGTVSVNTGAQICQSAVSNGHDPATECGSVNGTSCDDLHNTFLQNGQCCCPSGQSCDPNASNACVPTCSSASDCTDPSRPACAPTFGNVNGSVVVAGPYICVPNDGNLGHGCNGLQTCDGVGSNVDLCATDSRGNSFCTTTCTGDATCGNSGTACCNVAKGSTQACGLCGHP